jgi:phosphohistidine phosphatase
MKVYFLRHGEADWPHWDKPDDERPLTRKGKKEMRKVAKFLADTEVAPAAILTSPLPRALQTAEIAAKALDLDVTEEPSLAPGFDAEKLSTLLLAHATKDIMLVGHEPDFSTVISVLTGGSVKLAKAGVARVDIEAGMKGQLIWLIPPKIATSKQNS